MENLNAETIKKALECCAAAHSSYCRHCPIDIKKQENCECGTFLAGQALALITSQEQRIGELTEESERLRNRITCQVVLPDEKLEEIKNECLERVELDIKKIEADTVRKMRERLKDGINEEEYTHNTGYLIWLIDQIAKELLNDAGE